MALQTSGAISLNDIHIEVGGSSGTSVSLNDADVRGLINKASGVSMSMNEWYGASAVQLQPTLSLTTRSSVRHWTDGKFNFYFVGFNGIPDDGLVVPTNYGNVNVYDFLTSSSGIADTIPGSSNISQAFFDSVPKTFIRTNTNATTGTNHRDYYAVNPEDLGYTHIHWNGETKQLKPATANTIPIQGDNSSLTGGLSVSYSYTTPDDPAYRSWQLCWIGPVRLMNTDSFANTSDASYFGWQGDALNKTFKFIGS